MTPKEREERQPRLRKRIQSFLDNTGSNISDLAYDAGIDEHELRMFFYIDKDIIYTDMLDMLENYLFNLEERIENGVWDAMNCRKKPNSTTPPRVLLEGHPRPTLPQIAWVLANISDCIQQEGASFRNMIYDHMGLRTDAYSPLYLAGGQNITNLISSYFEYQEKFGPLEYPEVLTVDRKEQEEGMKWADVIRKIEEAGWEIESIWKNEEYQKKGEKKVLEEMVAECRKDGRSDIIMYCVWEVGAEKPKYHFVFNGHSPNVDDVPIAEDIVLAFTVKSEDGMYRQERVSMWRDDCATEEEDDE